MTAFYNEQNTYAPVDDYERAVDLYYSSGELDEPDFDEPDEEDEDEDDIEDADEDDMDDYDDPEEDFDGE